MVMRVSTGSWTHFVKATFAKHSGDKKKAPSASLARSIFVTWLNGVPYDARDSPFLEEMKLSAAEYQTHSLAIANSHYDKDAASEAKLRVLVDFCDSYAQWRPAEEKASVAAAAAAAAGLSENIDSDEDEESAASPSASMDLGEGLDDVAADSAPPAEERKQARPARRPVKLRASDSDSEDSEGSYSSGDDDGSDGEGVRSPAVDDTEYLPDRIIAKKTVGWQDFYLIHWLGYSAAERTWEPAAFFDQWCTKQTYEYGLARRPERIVSQRARPRPAGKSKAAAEEPQLYFEVQWQGRSETSLEHEQLMRDEYPDVLKKWQEHERDRLTTRKRHRATEPDVVAGQTASKRARKG